MHGADDTVAPVEGARAFVEELRNVSHSPVVYLEIPGAGHAFDIVPSLRTGATVEAVADYLRALRASTSTSQSAASQREIASATPPP